ncbi:MAG: DNA repair exonuclease, partial [Oscillospiraceae bacterium]
PYRESDPLRGFMAPKDGKPQIGVLHGDVGGKGRYGPIEEASIAVSGLTYLALGHVHSFAGLQKTGETCWAYSGCLEGRGFDETGDKGALVVTSEGEKVAVKFCPLPARRYEILSVDVTEQDPKQALLQALPQDRQGDCYRILLTGESGEEGIDLAPLRALAEPLFYSVAIQDRTRVRQDVWKRCGEETLTGGFLREMKSRIGRCEEGDDARLDRALRFGLAALEHREVPQ